MRQKIHVKCVQSNAEESRSNKTGISASQLQVKQSGHGNEYSCLWTGQEKHRDLTGRRIETSSGDSFDKHKQWRQDRTTRT